MNKKKTAIFATIGIIVIALAAVIIILASSVTLTGQSTDNDDANNNTDNSSTDSGNDTSSDANIINKNPAISDIQFQDDKINIYFFWGDGCAYCEKEFEFWERIQKEYGGLYNIYAFEVWYDESNSELMSEFAATLDESISGVPFTVIGTKAFRGFSASIESEMTTAIQTEHETRTKTNPISNLIKDKSSSS